MELDTIIKKELENINLFNHEIKSTSDRACAIVCAALLDDMLQKYFFLFYVKIQIHRIINYLVKMDLYQLLVLKLHCRIDWDLYQNQNMTI